jgi:co-chaperonin GroES (HSP10)
MKAAVQEAVETKYAIRPREKWVIIRKFIRGEQVTDEGVIIPEAKDDRSQRGEVVALSSCAGRTANGVEIPWDIAVGDTVIFSNYAMDIPAVEELTGEKNLALVQADEVFGVAEEVHGNTLLINGKKTVSVPGQILLQSVE